MTSSYPTTASNHHIDDDEEEEESDSPDTTTSNFLPSIGNQRYQSDKRQLGGLLLVLGICATFQPLDNICTLIGNGYNGDIAVGIVDGASGSEVLISQNDDNISNNDLTAIEKSQMAAGLIQIGFGCLGIVVGYLSLVHDYGSKKLSVALIILTQLAWMPYLVELCNIGLTASSPYTESTYREISNGQFITGQYIDNPWIPPNYLPDIRDVRYFGAMGILAVIAYGFAFIGSFAFMAFALYAFEEGRPQLRDARYYRGRLLVYTSVLTLAGVSQLLLGSYIIFEFGNGPLLPPMGVAMYMIHYPEISIAIGTLQMCVGYFGMARYIGWAPNGPNDHQFQFLVLVQFVSMLVLQFLVQIGYSPNTASAPSIALLSVGLNIMPAFLDYKMRVTPEYITDEHYGISSLSCKTDQNQKVPLLVPGQQQKQRDAPTGSEDSVGVLNSNPENRSRQTDSTSAVMTESYDVENSQNPSNQYDDIQSTEFLSASPTLRNQQEPSEEFQDETLRSTEDMIPQPSSTKAVQWHPIHDSDVVSDTNVEDSPKPEPSARLDSRSVDRNALTNEMYKQLNQSQSTSVRSNKSRDKSVSVGGWDVGSVDEGDESVEHNKEPSARLNSRRIDPNEIINQMYEENEEAVFRTEPLNDTDDNENTDRTESSGEDLRASLQPIRSSFSSDAGSKDPSSEGARSNDNNAGSTRPFDSQRSDYSQSIDGYSQPSAGYSQPSYSAFEEDDGRSTDVSALSGVLSGPSFDEMQSVDSDEYHSDGPMSPSRGEDPPERLPKNSDDALVREMFGQGPPSSQNPEEDQGITKYKTTEDLTPSNDVSDDSSNSTAVLEGKLEDIENEIFTDAMESFRDSLVNIL